MLEDFLRANRTELITRCRTKAAKRFVPSETPAALEHGVPLFLQQLVEALRLPQKPSGPWSRRQLSRRSVAPRAYTARTCYARDTPSNRSSANTGMCVNLSPS